VAALVGARIGGTEAHVLSAIEHGVHPPESFGRINHLPKKRLAAVMAGLRKRGLVDADGRFTDAGRETKRRIEALTDELAVPPYDASPPPSSTSWSPSSNPSPQRWWPRDPTDQASHGERDVRRAQALRHQQCTRDLRQVGWWPWTGTAGSSHGRESTPGPAGGGCVDMMWWYGNGISGWVMALMMIGNVLFWAVIILGGVALVRYLMGDRSTVATDARPTPEQLLAERFARGEIDEQEYRRRLDTLTHEYRARVEH